MEAERSQVEIDAGALQEAPLGLIDAAVRTVLAAEGREDVEISIALLSDADIRELNARYLGRDRPTDVLAFALGEVAEIVGDVYIGFEQAERQARSLGVPFHEELVRLAIHGTLHVLGHEHPEGSERDVSPMFLLQERLLKRVLAETGPA